MSDANKAVVVLYYETAERDLVAAADFLAEDALAHFGGSPRPLGKAAWLAYAAAFFTGFPDLRHHLTDVTATRDRVGVRMQATGTHRGDFMGAPASGRTISVAASGIYRVADGKIVEAWIHFDGAGLMRQITEDLTALTIQQTEKIVVAITNRAFEELDALFWPTYVHHEPGLPPQGLHGIDAIRTAGQRWSAAQERPGGALSDVFSDGHLVYGRWSVDGTSRLMILRFVGERVAEGWFH